MDVGACGFAFADVRFVGSLGLAVMWLWRLAVVGAVRFRLCGIYGYGVVGAQCNALQPHILHPIRLRSLMA